MGDAELKPRRLRGHTATATCCIASRERHGVIVTAGEDGCICWFDLRCKDAQLIIDVGNEPVTSLCLKSGNEDIVYASSGKEVKSFDVRMGASWKALECYNYNKEEIDQIACNTKSSFLACADDGGDVKVCRFMNSVIWFFLGRHYLCHYFVPLTLLNRSAVLCNSFLGNLGKLVGITAHRRCCYSLPLSQHIIGLIYSVILFEIISLWVIAVITGGLDSKLVMWDFSKGRPLKIIDFGLPDMNSSNTGQCYNPAFVHAIAVPDVDMLDKTDKICVVARGDGVIDVVNIESELSTIRSKNSTKAWKGSQSIPKDNPLAGEMETLDLNGGKRLHLDYSLGGHTAAASCVAFSLFGEKGKYIISGGNDKSVKVWDCSRFPRTGQTGTNSDLLHMNINLNRKVNWLCTSPTESENLVVCDTSKVVKVYTIS
ncbi:hypothetical protein Pint_10356 [Pistacia integerrima]|uniref:Uncharacterized protein n=1 Tax=Pistacia integerrima TaxID=434235 RepID=A0ACC0XF05_9ROSI|nr:hypothetical protein Pint_10356 [Pistacia integerrima]